MLLCKSLQLPFLPRTFSAGDLRVVETDQDRSCEKGFFHEDLPRLSSLLHPDCAIPFFAERKIWQLSHQQCGKIKYQLVSLSRYQRSAQDGGRASVPRCNF